MATTLQWGVVMFGLAAAVVWLWASLTIVKPVVIVQGSVTTIPDMIRPTPRGPMDVAATAQRQSVLNAAAAFLTALSVLLQALSTL